jgi:ATP-binding cassette, subfamily B, bacterial MsbA
MYMRLLRYMGPYKALVPVSILAMAVLAMTTALYAFLLGPGISHLVTSGERGFSVVTKHFPALDTIFGTGAGDFSNLGFVLIGVVLVKGIAYGTQFITLRWIGAQVVVDVRNELFRKTLDQEMTFFDERQQGELVSRFTTDVQHVEVAVVDALASAIRSGLVISALVLQCFLLDPWLALVAFGAVPAAAIPITVFIKVIRKIAKSYLESLGQVTAHITQSLGAVRLIKATAAEDREVDAVIERHAGFLAIMWRSIVARGLYSPVIEFLGVFGLAAVLWYANARMALPADHVDHLEPEFFVSFFLTLVLIYAPIKEMSRVSTLMATGLGAAERLFEILDREPTIQDADDAQAAAPFAHSIDFQGVQFAYPGEHADVAVLSGIDFSLPQGKTFALVGMSGSGKSTLINLIPRFYDVTGGSVSVDGTDVRQLTQQSLRHQIAMVSQDVVLLNDSLRANIAYGRPEASDDEVRAAAEAAQAWEFIAGFPKGMDTVVGDRGVRLSGGQRQRIAIARALLRDAPILLLDEATSALDSESERLVQAALEHLMTGRTVLVIAHRLSTVRRADQILVIQSGVVADRGTHDELMAKDGYYARQIELEMAAQNR